MRRLCRVPVGLVLAASAVGALACNLAAVPPPVDPDAVYSPERPTFSAAARTFFGRRDEPRQPLEFPHDIHAKQGIGCTEYCHESVAKGPVAGLPSVKTCMICHQAIATDRPRIQTITALEAKGVDLNWQRVYGYPAESHVRFDHAPHIRAAVECATCHGPIAQHTVAVRTVDLSMGVCVNCHAERKASNDCQTCHY